MTVADYDPQRNRRRPSSDDAVPAPVEAILAERPVVAERAVDAEPEPVAPSTTSPSTTSPASVAPSTTPPGSVEPSVAEDDRSFGAPRPLPTAPLGEESLPLARLGVVGAAVAGVMVVTAWRQWRRRRRSGEG